MWCYDAPDGTSRGPVTELELLRMLKSEEIRAETYVWNNHKITL